MTKIAVTVEARPSFRDLAGRWAAASDTVLERSRGDMRRLAVSMRDIARQEAPGSRFPSTIGYQTYVKRGREVGFRLRMLAPLGWWIIEGTDAHEIKPRGPYPLRFFWENGPDGPGEYRFMRVWHPGTQPNDFLGRAHDRWKPEGIRGLRRIAANFVIGVTGR